MSQKLINRIAICFSILVAGQAVIKWGVDGCLTQREATVFPAPIAAPIMFCKPLVHWDGVARSRNTTLHARLSLSRNPIYLTYLNPDQFGPFDPFYFWRMPHDAPILLSKIPGGKAALAKLVTADLLIALMVAYAWHYLGYIQGIKRRTKKRSPKILKAEEAERQSATRAILPAYREDEKPKPLRFTTRPTRRDR